MNMRAGLIMIVAPLLIALGGPAWSQAEAKPTIEPAIGAATRSDQLQRRLDTLKEQRKDLRERAQSEAGWQARAKTLETRAETISKIRAARIREAPPSAAERRWTGSLIATVPQAPPSQTPPDAGAAPDFGATPDAGAATDPSTAPDAEVTDAGVGDAQAS
ncbi:MAG: hypothetical protein ACI9U2_004929, partial [Bradymonadia bacterium]